MMLIYESLSLKMLGVSPSKVMIPLVKESITPSMSVMIYSKSDMMGLIMPTY